MRLLDFSEASRRTLVRMFAEFGVLALVVGFWLGEKGYFAGFVGGVSANCFAVAFGLWAVDRYADARKRAEWERVHGWAIAEVMFSLWNLASQAAMFLRLPSPDVGGFLERQPDRPDKTAAALRLLSEELKKKAEPLQNEMEADEEFISAEEALGRFLIAASLPCDDLQRVLLPVLVQAGADPILIEALMRFGQTYRKIKGRQAEQTVIGVLHKTVTAYYFKNVVELLDRGAQLYEVAHERRYKPPSSPGAANGVSTQNGKLSGS